MDTQTKMELFVSYDIACITPGKNAAEFEIEFMQDVESVELARNEMSAVLRKWGIQPGNYDMIRTNLIMTRGDYERSLVSASR